MIRRIRIRNFRSHIDTELILGPVTLLIGPNLSGKTNLLLGMQELSRLVRLGRPLSRFNPTIAGEHKSIANYAMFNKCRYAGRSAPISFACDWESTDGDRVSYHIDIHGSARGSTCKETMVFMEAVAKGRRGKKNYKEARTVRQESSELRLAAKILADPETSENEKVLVSSFYRDVGSAYYFHFEPSALRAHGEVYQKPNVRLGEEENLDSDVSGEVLSSGAERLTLNVAQKLGMAGQGLHAVMDDIVDRSKLHKLYCDQVYVSLEQYAPEFRGYDPSERRWKFVQGKTIQGFPDDQVADGFLRACAVSLLTSMPRPPSMIMLEELENGMDILRLELLVDWIRNSSVRTGYRNNSQFLISSHSPIVLRRFADSLESVYQIRFDSERQRSVSLNLEALLRTDVDRGHVKGRVIDGHVHVKPDVLVNLWLNRTIGGETLFRAEK